MTSEDFIDIKSLKITQIELGDLESVNELMKSASYDVGLNNLKIYYNCSDTTFWKRLKNKNGEIIAIEICNLLPNGVNFYFSLVVKPELRGKGVSNVFKKHWLDRPFMANESLSSVQFYSSDVIECWRGKLLAFYGTVSENDAQTYTNAHPSTADFCVERITEENVEKLYEFDKDIIKLERNRFLKEWCCTEDSQAFLAVKNNRCVGLGVLRNFTSRYSISPLYADDDTIATALLAKLAECLKNNTILYIPVQSHQRVAIQFCHSLKLKFYTSEVGDCSLAALAYAKSLNMKKVYVGHDFWPV